jgi:hypothetical protein
MHWSADVLQAGQRGDLSAVLGVVESAGKDFDATAVEAALAQVRCISTFDSLLSQPAS